MKGVVRKNDPFFLVFISFPFGNVSIYVDNSMDSSSDQQLLGDTGETDSQIKKTNN